MGRPRRDSSYLGVALIGLIFVFAMVGLPMLVGESVPGLRVCLGVVGIVGTLAAAILGHTWRESFVSLPDFRGKVRASRPLIATMSVSTALLAIPLFFVMWALGYWFFFSFITFVAFGSFMGMERWGAVFAGPIFMLSPVCAAFTVGYQFRWLRLGDAMRAWMDRMNGVEYLLSSAQAHAVPSAWEGIVDGALGSAAIISKEAKPLVFVTDELACGAWGIANEWDQAVVIVSAGLLAEADEPALVALLVWMIARTAMSPVLDSPNKLQPLVECDQIAMHAVYSPEAVLRLLRACAHGPAQPLSPALAPFSPDAETARERIGVLKGTVFLGRAVDDPIHWETPVDDPLPDGRVGR